MNNLHPIARAVQSQGRNQDTQLVHMTPGEVQGLQALAMAHGGSLTINPSTGLPEAGILKDILPAIAGFALGPAGFGLMSSAGAGLAVGAGVGILKGDLGEGFKAGLGAWGGASLGEGILGAGQAAVGGQAAASAAADAARIGKAGAGAVANAARESAIQEATKSQLLKEGAKSALSNPAAFMDTMGGFGKTASAIGAAGLPAMLSQQTATKMPEKRTPTTVAQLEYRRQVAQPRRDPYDTSEQQWFTGPGYVKTGETTYAAEGGVMGYAQGGAPITGGKRAILSNEEYLNQYFSPVQTATQMPGVRKAEGGIVSLADGGLSDYSPYRSSYKPMTPEEFSRMYFGQQATPTGLPGGVSGYEGREPYQSTPTSPISTTPGTGGQSDVFTDENGKKYRLEFDAATGTYRKIYEAETPVAPTPGAGGGAGIAGLSSSGGGGDMPTGPNYWAQREAELAKTMSPEAVRAQILAEQVQSRKEIPAKLLELLTPGVTAIKTIGNFFNPPTKSYAVPFNQMSREDKEYAQNINPPAEVMDAMISVAEANDAAGNAAAAASLARGVDPATGKSITPIGLVDFGGPGSPVGGGGGGDSGVGGGGGDAVAISGDAGQAASVSGDTAGVGGIDPGSEGWKDGGLLALAAGGMSKGGFVVPADVVSALGNGSTDAGLRTLQAKLGAINPIKGNGDGLSDSIATTIDGKQPARVADGEAYIDPKTVAKIGGGDMRKGAKKLYAMMDKIRQQAHGKTTQQRKVNPAKVVKA